MTLLSQGNLKIKTRQFMYYLLSHELLTNKVHFDLEKDI